MSIPVHPAAPTHHLWSWRLCAAFPSHAQEHYDHRRFILYEQGWAAWRARRRYVENVAAALALAVVNEQASGRIYNVAESPAYSELE